MAKGTIWGIHAILSGAFEAAMRWDWADRTRPNRPGLPPQAARPSWLLRRKMWPRSSPRPARSAALGLYLWLVMVTGVRRGELSGLQIS